MELNKALRKLRKENGFTQQAVADILNVDRSTYSCYEQGKFSPSLDCIVQLAELYQISVDELLGNEAADYAISAPAPEYNVIVNTVLSDDEEKLIKYFRQLSNSRKSELIDELTAEVDENSKDN